MTTQLELPVSDGTEALIVEKVNAFVDLVHARVDWTSSKIIAQSTGWTDREIRSFAEASSPKIISGQKGYKHVAHATPEEITHCVKWMESQGKKMISRAEQIRRFAHQLIG